MNRYGIAIDYLELIEALYDAGVAACIELKLDAYRTWGTIPITATVHIRGVEHGVTITLKADILLHGERKGYLECIAYEIAASLGRQVFHA